MRRSPPETHEEANRERERIAKWLHKSFVSTQMIVPLVAGALAVLGSLYGGFVWSANLATKADLDRLGQTVSNHTNQIGVLQSQNQTLQRDSSENSKKLDNLSENLYHLMGGLGIDPIKRGSSRTTKRP